MQNLNRVVTGLSSTSRVVSEKTKCVVIASKSDLEAYHRVALRLFSTAVGSGGNGSGDDDWGRPAATPFGSAPSNGWTASSWSTGIPKETVANSTQSRVVSGSKDSGDNQLLKELRDETRKSKRFADGWANRFKETCDLVKQAYEPGARGAYLKDSEKDEMYQLHKKSPEVNTVEKLAKDYRVMRQRVHAILWLKELEEEQKKLGRPLDDCTEKLLDNFPELFESQDREFHVASLSRKPDFKVMPEDWDGTTRDADEVHFEISQKEDEIIYQEFVQKLNFVKKKVAGEVYSHKYSRRRPSEGWKFTVEKMGPRGKRGGGGGWKFVCMPDGSSRPLNELEKMFLKRETPRPPHRILPTYRGA